MTELLPPWLANYTLVSRLHRYIDSEKILAEGTAGHVEVSCDIEVILRSVVDLRSHCGK